jgi:hypothetical protein
MVIAISATPRVPTANDTIAIAMFRAALIM